MSDHPIISFDLRSDRDLVVARQRTRRIAELLGLDRQHQTRVATAVSEIVRNALRYARRGHVSFNVIDGSKPALKVTIADEGPGIANLDAVLNGSYVSRTGMGVGIVSARRLSDGFDVKTGSDGTRIILEKRLPAHTPPLDERHVAYLREELRREEPGGAVAEVEEQNHELLTAINQLERERVEIDRLNRELAETNRGVLALYAELDEKAESLRKASEEKSRFLSNMSHEFRTPLNSIISLTQILLAEADGPLTDEQRKQVTFIRSSARSLFDMVNDLLDIAKIEAGKLPVRPSQFLLDDFIAALRSMFLPQVPEGIALEYHVEQSGKLFTDEAKLSQIARNFISNALKYTDRGSVTVTARLSNDFLELSVTDTGIGISPENIDKIFLEFTQIENPLQKRSKGTGLGLTLTRRLTELLGGSIDVSSEQGKGSTFTARIPRVYEPKESEEEAVAIVSALIADDDEAARYIARTLLPRGTAILEAASGDAALQILGRERVDVVLLDVVMPGMSGLDVLRELRRATLNARTPVVILTSKSLSEDEMQSIRDERAVFLSKSDAQPERAAATIGAAVRAIRQPLQ